MRITIIIALAAVLLSCGRSTPGNNGANGNNAGTNSEPPEAADRRREVLADIADNAILATYEDFRTKAGTLSDAAQAWASSGSAADREAAQAAWREAMLSWEVAEISAIGPAGGMGLVVGGQDLRDHIYSWPTKNPCRVDQEIVEQAYEDAAAFREENVNVRGLDTLEYLLFHGGTENACSEAGSINADGSWAALDEAELDARRAAYAQIVAADIVVSIDALLGAWNDSFRQEFAEAGAGSTLFPGAQDALNALTDSLFYIDGELKDMKLAEPAGLLNCAEALCPDQREFLWEDISFEAIAANLDGFRAVFTGGEGLGFDDLLVDAGQEALADDMLATIDAARDAARSQSGTMGEVLASDPDAVVALHAKVKAITDLLKTQFLSVLDLELPLRAEGDND